MSYLVATRLDLDVKCSLRHGGQLTEKLAALYLNIKALRSKISRESMNTLMKHYLEHMKSYGGLFWSGINGMIAQFLQGARLKQMVRDYNVTFLSAIIFPISHCCCSKTKTDKQPSYHPMATALFLNSS